jgi:hypothetical protein
MVYQEVGNEKKKLFRGKDLNASQRREIVAFLKEELLFTERRACRVAEIVLK